jgi:hypothetical protein
MNVLPAATGYFIIEPIVEDDGKIFEVVFSNYRMGGE